MHTLILPDLRSSWFKKKNISLNDLWWRKLARHFIAKYRPHTPHRLKFLNMWFIRIACVISSGTWILWKCYWIGHYCHLIRMVYCKYERCTISVALNALFHLRKVVVRLYEATTFLHSPCNIICLASVIRNTSPALLHREVIHWCIPGPE